MGFLNFAFHQPLQDLNYDLNLTVDSAMPLS